MENTDEVVQFRIRRSDETLDEATLLSDAGHYNTAINRLYYAAFYAVSAVLLKENIYSKTHAGLKSKFHELIIKTGKIPVDTGKVY